MIYVDAGTVHAIGPGSVLVETQQNSDTTYRLYDYGRPRQLHIEDGLAVTKEQTCAGKVLSGKPQVEQGVTRENLVTSPCFIVDRLRLVQPWQARRGELTSRNVWSLVATRGSGRLECSGINPVDFRIGDAVVIPAAQDQFVVRPDGELEFLCSSVPVEKVSQPATVLLETASSNHL
jgi:mannose-6-phosphate isomerase